MDLSPLRKFEVTGPDAEALMQYCVTRDMRKLSTGQVAYTAMCYEHGGMIDDGTVFRLGAPEIEGVMLLALLGGVVAFTITYAYLMTLRLRVGRLQEREAREALSPIVEEER